jgi:dTDP-4-amino-4,6-dideoxygalactose transaminase
MQNAIPVFADIDSEALALSPHTVEKAITPLTRAIVHVHLFGYPSKVNAIRKIADKHNLLLIEDASHAHGLRIDGHRAGSFGDVSVFSLHQRKAISVGDGGVVCTNNLEIAEKIRRLRSFGDKELSYNYRMTEFAGALGKVGLARLDNDNKERAEAAAYLAGELERHPWLKVRLAAEGQHCVYHAVLLESTPSGPNSEELSAFLVSNGIPAKKTWSPLHKHPHFNQAVVPARGLPWRHPDYKGVMQNRNYTEIVLPVAERLVPDRITELYTHPGVSSQQLDLACKLLSEFKV